MGIFIQSITKTSHIQDLFGCYKPLCQARCALRADCTLGKNVAINIWSKGTKNFYGIRSHCRIQDVEIGFYKRADYAIFCCYFIHQQLQPPPHQDFPLYSCGTRMGVRYNLWRFTFPQCTTKPFSAIVSYLLELILIVV